jgi:nitroimidazol reductase NimA-like FMN-containing flavoprotein (pyridoxamine 5'-phosphate oxidase superfamily)
MSHEFIDSLVEMEEILRENTLGYLGVNLGGNPYVVPLNYSYADAKIIIHCARDGVKLDAIRENPRVCFAVGRQEGELRRHATHSLCHVDSDSVLCFGVARILESPEEAAAALNEFKRAFDPAGADITPKEVAACSCVVISVHEMTGRREIERKRTLWRHVFESD